MNTDAQNSGIKKRTYGGLTKCVRCRGRGSVGERAPEHDGGVIDALPLCRLPPCNLLLAQWPQPHQNLDPVQVPCSSSTAIDRLRSSNPIPLHQLITSNGPHFLPQSLPWLLSITPPRLQRLPKSHHPKTSARNKQAKHNIKTQTKRRATPRSWAGETHESILLLWIRVQGKAALRVGDGGEGKHFCGP
jgi:hypothetical protein